MISVVICTYNRQDSLRRTLISLNEMSVPDELSWELIIVDNNSKDETQKVLQEFMGTSKIDCKYVFEGVQGKTHALNRGVKEAKGEIIALTDDDVIVDKNWLTSIQNAFDGNNIACLGGKILPLWEKPKPKWLEGRCLFDLLAIVDLGEESIQLSTPKVWGANLAIKSSMFIKYGYFDTALGNLGEKIYGTEDLEMVRTILNHNETVIYAPEVIVHHCIPETRLKRSYFRKWVFDKGELRGILLGKYTKRNIIGIPYLWIKYLIQSFYRYLWAQIVSPRNAFEKQLWMVYNIGKCVGRIKNRNI